MKTLCVSPEFSTEPCNFYYNSLFFNNKIDNGTIIALLMLMALFVKMFS